MALLPQFGIGIEIGRSTLRAAAVRAFLGKVQIVDRLEINDVDGMAASECGRIYGDFLRRNGLEAPWTTVVLPREAFIYRELKLPRSVKDELQSVMSLQIDSLHPYADEAIVWDSCLRGGSSAEHSPGSTDRAVSPMVWASVGLARRSKVEALDTWLEERAIPVSQFAVSPQLFRSIAQQAASTSESVSGTPVVLAYYRNAEWELQGVSSAEKAPPRVLSVDSSEGPDSVSRLIQEIGSVLADLRVDRSNQPILMLGGEQSLSEDSLARIASAIAPLGGIREISAGALAEEAARLAVLRGRESGINLLPVDRRRFVPSVSMVPTYALAALVLLLAVAAGLRGTVQDWLYSRQLDTEIASLQPRVSQIEAIRGREQQTYGQLLELTGIRSTAQVPLEVLEDLTQALPKDAWLQSLQMEGNALTISGSAASASGVLQAISDSATLESAQFLSAISRSNSGEESFRIGAKLKRRLR